MSYGGAGAKTLEIVKGNADLLIYNRSGSSRWDNGPSEVFMKCLGGMGSGCRGSIYNFSGEDGIVNEEGMYYVNSLELW